MHVIIYHYDNAKMNYPSEMTYIYIAVIPHSYYAQKRSNNGGFGLLHTFTRQTDNEY